MQLHEIIARSLLLDDRSLDFVRRRHERLVDVRTNRVHARTKYATGRYGIPQLEDLGRAAQAQHRRHAIGDEQREQQGLLVRRVAVEMDVHVGETRDEILPRPVDRLRAGRNGHAARIAHACDATVLNDDCLVVEHALDVHGKHVDADDGDRRRDVGLLGDAGERVGDGDRESGKQVHDDRTGHGHASWIGGHLREL